MESGCSVVAADWLENDGRRGPYSSAVSFAEHGTAKESTAACCPVPFAVRGKSSSKAQILSSHSNHIQQVNEAGQSQAQCALVSWSQAAQHGLTSVEKLYAPHLIPPDLMIARRFWHVLVPSRLLQVLMCSQAAHVCR